MREFYRTYENEPTVMCAAMEIGWTQNIVILEAGLTLTEKAWYIRAVRRFGWSKLALIEQIEERAHEQIDLDTEEKACYTVPTETGEEAHDENPLYVSREYLDKALKPLKTLAFSDGHPPIYTTVTPLHQNARYD